MGDTTTGITTTEIPTTESDMNFIFPNISILANSSENSTTVVGSYSKEIFILFEFIVVILECMITVLAAYRIPRWSRNHRNQMMMQLILTNLMRCSVLVLSFYQKKYCPELICSVVIMFLKFYIDVVVIVTFCFFVKHMYETLILVIVKNNQKKVTMIFWISWLMVPVPLAAVATAIVSAGVLEKWTMRLIICGVFKWPLMFLGTVVYVTILYRVLTEKIRVFARNLTIITFSMCFLLNFYILFKDIVHLWCFQSFKTVLISYTVGFILNLIGLLVYITYVIQCSRTSKARQAYSLRLSGVDKSVTIA